MRKMKDALKNHAFLVVAYAEDSKGELSGPHPVHGTSTINRARELCSALLWLEKDKWSAVAIVAREGFREVARFRRFPPGRIRDIRLNGVVLRDVDSPFAEDANGRGPRLAISSDGGRQKSFGGKL